MNTTTDNCISSVKILHDNLNYSILVTVSNVFQRHGLLDNMCIIYINTTPTENELLFSYENQNLFKNLFSPISW